MLNQTKAAAKRRTVRRQATPPVPPPWRLLQQPAFLFFSAFTAEVAAAARCYTTAKPCGGDGAAPHAAVAAAEAVGCQLDFGVLVLKQILKKITFELNRQG